MLIIACNLGQCKCSTAVHQPSLIVNYHLPWHVAPCPAARSCSCPLCLELPSQRSVRRGSGLRALLSGRLSSWSHLSVSHILCRGCDIEFFSTQPSLHPHSCCLQAASLPTHRHWHQLCKYFAWNNRSQVVFNTPAPTPLPRPTYSGYHTPFTPPPRPPVPRCCE